MQICFYRNCEDLGKLFVISVTAFSKVIGNFVEDPFICKREVNVAIFFEVLYHFFCASAEVDE